MDPKHAAYALRELLKTPTVIPIHYGAVGLLKGTPDEFIQAFGETPTEGIVNQPGETREF